MAVTFLTLPQEVRNLVYAFLLESHSPETTWGPGSGIDANILATCSRVRREASPHLYDFVHILHASGDCPRFPPTEALRRLRHIYISVEYATQNRGECEVEIRENPFSFALLHRVALAARHSIAPLASLRIDLFNKNQRKRGPRLVRSQLVRGRIKSWLYPFSFLPKTVDVEVGGFDAIEWADLFEEMRHRNAGQEIHYGQEMIAEALKDLHRSR